jgi:hypothetical protein
MGFNPDLTGYSSVSLLIDPKPTWGDFDEFEILRLLHFGEGALVCE